MHVKSPAHPFVTLLCAAAAALPAACGGKPPPPAPSTSSATTSTAAGSATLPRSHPRAYKVVHVFVPLCDNKNQGIVPVPDHLGNGQDPGGNLYWGARYGVRTFFKRSGLWDEVATARPDNPIILDRCLFARRGEGTPAYVLADAYDGARMAEALRDFLEAAAGQKAADATAALDGREETIQAGGRSDLVCFVGHNGLMDLQLPGFPRHGGGPNPAGAVVLACRSRSFFLSPLREAGCPPLLTTTGLMAPEAYVLEAAIRSWSDGADPEAIRKAAAGAYARYQNISERAAERLFAARDAAHGK